MSDILGDPPLPGVIVEPGGAAAGVSITSPGGVVPTVYADAFGVTTVSMPASISARTTFYLPSDGPWLVNGQTVVLEGAQVATVYAGLANVPRATGLPWVFTSTGNAGNSISQGIHHPNFWPPGPVPLGLFFWEAWVKPNLGSQIGYIVSEGSGGAHALLWGLQGSTGGRAFMSGNIWDGSAAHSFTSVSGTGLADGEWGHVAVGWDGSSIHCWLNGVRCGVTAYSSTRTASVAGSPGDLFVGGSSHINFSGSIAAVRGYEGQYPLAGIPPNEAFVPDRGFLNTGGNTWPIANFIADYTTPGLIFPDQSQGFAGRLHPGRLFGTAYNAGSVFASATPNNFVTGAVPVYPYPGFTVDTGSPFAVTGAPALPNELIDTPPATPSGAAIFDSFSRRNQTFAFQTAPTLGSTEGGSMGPLAWSILSGTWGILCGRAVCLGTGGVAAVDCGDVNHDVRVDRWQTSTTAPAEQMSARAWLCFRVTDKDNYYDAYGDPTSGLAIRKVVSGSATNLATASDPGGGWTTLRVTASGSTLTLYTGLNGTFTQRAQVSDSTYTTQTKVGLPNLSVFNSMNRYDNFTVINL